ncbi:MAG: OmpA family protein [Acidobacteria bacterium]|nr:OmpA family protein [Acidobacteriota bacterium]
MMQQDVVADASVFKEGIAAMGHVEVPGIYFDSGKSDLKQESQPALSEIQKLLNTNPSLKVWVVGHTDSTGMLESNLVLSAARAAAVVKVLTEKMGVDARRLGAFGAGPYAPVASNRTEKGRARNRRVELVEQP